MTGPVLAPDELAAATEADRLGYLEGGMRGVECGRCGTVVRVRKYGLAQTSIQWTGDAQRRCPAFDARTGCPDLRRSIDDAVAVGLLHVPRD